MVRSDKDSFRAFLLETKGEALRRLTESLSCIFITVSLPQRTRK